MNEISLDMPLCELMLLDSSLLDVLARYGLGCAACLGAQFETLRDACMAHNLDAEAVLTELNRALSQGEN